MSTGSSSGSSSGGDAPLCPSGTYQCGAGFCTPLGNTCCANVGRPSSYCPGGAICTTDGRCRWPETGSTTDTSSSESSSYNPSYDTYDSGSYDDSYDSDNDPYSEYNSCGVSALGMTQVPSGLGILFAGLVSAIAMRRRRRA